MYLILQLAMSKLLGMTGFIFNANYSLFPTVEFQVLGALLVLKTAIRNSNKLII